jgi:hypothetical protein
MRRKTGDNPGVAAPRRQDAAPAAWRRHRIDPGALVTWARQRVSECCIQRQFIWDKALCQVEKSP